MSCESFRKHLYEDNITPEVRHHLSQCVSCLELSRRLERWTSAAVYDLHLDPPYAQFRKAIIAQKARYLELEPSQWLLRFARLAAAAVILAFVAILPLRRLQQPASPEVVNFQLGKVNHAVALKWQGDPRRTYRIYRGPNPNSLKPVEEIRGIQWLDRSEDSQPILFYKIEVL